MRVLVFSVCVILTTGDDRATERMQMYKPAEHQETANVAPLEQFFELVHMGDTIQSMVQVYFDKELVRSRSISLKRWSRSYSDCSNGYRLRISTKRTF